MNLGLWKTVRGVSVAAFGRPQAVLHCHPEPHELQSGREPLREGPMQLGGAIDIMHCYVADTGRHAVELAAGAGFSGTEGDD
jgi:hypothetical protein